KFVPQTKKVSTLSSLNSTLEMDKKTNGFMLRTCTDLDFYRIISAFANKLPITLCVSDNHFVTTDNLGMFIHALLIESIRRRWIFAFTLVSNGSNEINLFGSRPSRNKNGTIVGDFHPPLLHDRLHKYIEIISRQPQVANVIPSPREILCALHYRSGKFFDGGGGSWKPSIRQFYVEFIKPKSTTTTKTEPEFFEENIEEEK